MWPGHQWIMDWVVVINRWLRALHIKHCHEIQPHNSRWELSDKCIMTWRLCVTGLMMCDVSKNNQSCDNFSVSYWTFGVVCYFIYYRNSNNLKKQCINIVMMWSHSTYQPVAKCYYNYTHQNGGPWTALYNNIWALVTFFS